MLLEAFSNSYKTNLASIGKIHTWQINTSKSHPTQLQEFIPPDTTSMRQLIGLGSGHSVNTFIIIISQVYPHVSVINIEADRVCVETAPIKALICKILNGM